jgi:hypothetical protein
MGPEQALKKVIAKNMLNWDLHTKMADIFCNNFLEVHFVTKESLYF